MFTVKGNFMKTGKISEFKLAWMPLPLFIVLFAVLILSQVTGSLKANLYTGLMICALFGCLMRSVVDNVPLIKKTLGGSFVAFACAFLVFFNLIPDTWIEACNTFINGDIDFLTCFVMTLICGSILSMDRDLLIAVGIRYFVPVILGITISYALAAGVGQVMGLGWKHTLLYIAGPIMGGGNGAGSMPMSEIYAGITGEDQGAVYSQLHAMVTLGNWLSIGGAVILNIVGEKFKSTTGNGKLLKNGNVNAGEVTYDFTFELSDLLIGICLVSGVFLTGRILSKIFPVVHAYAWSIVFVAAIKILNLVPKKWEFAAYKLYQFVNSKCQIILTAGLGIAMWNLAALFEALTVQSLIICTVTVVGGVIGAWIGGKIVGFYPVESAITGGLCMSNAGGSGDIYVLSSADRMELMPFAQVSSRLGGAIVLALQSILASMWL